MMKYLTELIVSALRMAGWPLVQGVAAVSLLPTASALPQKLAGYDPSQQVRFATAAQAEAKRRELIAFIWPDGLPAGGLPAVTRNIGREVFAGDLGGLDGTLAAAVEPLDAEVAPYDFHGISYLVRPRTVNANNRRMVMLNSGHRTDGRFAYGVNDAANRLLGEGFAVLMTAMPLVGFNTANLYDSCCFSGDAFKTYDNFVAGIVRKLGQGEWSFYSDTSHRSHLISPVALKQVIMPRLLGTVDPPPMVPMLFATESAVVRLDAQGNKIWESASGMSRDVWLLPNGNALFPCNFKPGVEGGVREVAPDGKVVWEFKTEGWVLSCQRLGDGNTLVGAAGKCALLIVDPAGKVLKEIKVQLRQSNIHSLTMARQLDNGHFLVVEEELRMVREYLPDGQVVWEFKPPFRPFAVVRTKDGNTFVSGQDGIVEVAPDKAVVWQVTREEVQDMGPRWFAGIQIRANGNIVVCNAGGKVPFYELNRDKKVVWQSTLPAGQPGLGHGIFLLDEKPPFLR